MEKKIGSCHCGTKNPKGKWCLGDVHQVVAKLKGKPVLNVIGWKCDPRKVLPMRTETRSNDIITLEHNLNPLRLRFNTDSNLIRFLALLSPTCPLWRDKGARAVHENVFNKYPNAKISGSIVWIPILDKDNFEAAIPSVKAFNDDRVHHYYDSNQAVGRTIADSVGWQGNIAWDIYLFYPPTAIWAKTPPKPEYWMHQLKDDWSTKERYRTGDDLKNELSESMKKLLCNY